MATYYPGSNNQREGPPMIYQLPGSYSETPVLTGNMMMYMNNAAGSYSDALPSNDIQSVEGSASSQHQEILANLGGSRVGDHQQHDYNTWRDNRNEMAVMQSIGDANNILQGGGQSLQGQGLSLSLGTQIPSGIQMHSIPYRNANQGFTSFLSTNPSSSSIVGDSPGRNDELRSAEYLQQGGYPGGHHHQDPGKGDFAQYGMTSIARTVPNSKYLKAAQQLLDEVVNVRKALRQQPDKEKSQKANENEMNSSKEGDSGSNKNDPQESVTNSATELSHSERQELQNKLTKLLSMLDEVDRRYKQYYHQMQIVVSSFDVIAGCGAAKPYTALALQTISRHFRCLRDAINGQIRSVRKSLGEQETSENSKGVAITRLRYVDQQLRQQRALQQLGMMQQHTWRPQRGLPENSVSILRAWLFEHFLHPYPKDSDKIMLARQTGLTRGQVSNWFINARVRLWKPMVEEMYKEETGDAEMDSNSSSENAARALSKADMRSSEDGGGEEMQQTVSSAATEKTDHIHHHGMEMAGSSSRPHFQFGDAMTEYGLMKLRAEQRPGVVDDCGGIYNDAIVDGSDRFIAAAYQMQEMGRYGSGAGGGVSLTLGLQHCEGGGNLPMPAASHHPSFVSMRGGDDMYNAGAASSVGGETNEFECVNPGNNRQQQQQQQQQHRFNSSHLLHDFVA
ncbi:BEL1-like homeodomain protein 6 [Linum perenne]